MEFSISVFAERLRKVRQDKKITIKELSEKIGLSPTTITSYELGKKVPSLENAFNIAVFFNISLEWLCGIDSTKKIYLENIGDIAEILVQISDLRIGFNPCFNFDGDGIVLFFDNSEIMCFLNDWIKMKDLKNEDVIDDFFYKEWLKVRFSELEKYKVPASDE